MQPGGVNDAYWGNPGPVNGFGRTSTDPLGTGAPPPWRSGEYVPPYFPYGHFEQGSIDHAGFPVVSGQGQARRRAATKEQLPFGNFPTAGLIMRRKENSISP
ncbi:hypothetical protein BJY52DRAFT_1229613 [Lactarius psammicola]|nr:hypothetical protein BJY52DRAFT_1229613 [Lactarius psammicola]